MKLGLVVSDTPAAEAGAGRLRPAHGFTSADDAEVLVVLGGDGFLLQTLHAMLSSGDIRPVFGMNCGTVGFLMNDFRVDDLPERVAAARRFRLSPLCMDAETGDGALVASPAINEVSLLRETRQAAKIEISIDGKVRLPELTCDGVLVATPAGSTAYNLSASGPILPLESDMLALTAISPFRPRRWHGALLPASSRISFRILEAQKRPVSAVADQVEVRDVTAVHVTTDTSRALELLFDPEYALDDRILMEQFQS
ncbi:MAG: NAD kinase [Thermaurantiacus sp.]